MLRKALVSAFAVIFASAYEDVKCSDCWFHVHENSWEIKRHNFPDYETAFWTCCFYCDAASASLRGLNPNDITGTTDQVDPSDDPRGTQISPLRRAYGDYVYNPGIKRNGLTGVVPAYFDSKTRKCPPQYRPEWYEKHLLTERPIYYRPGELDVEPPIQTPLDATVVGTTEEASGISPAGIPAAADRNLAVVPRPQGYEFSDYFPILDIVDDITQLAHHHRYHDYGYHDRYYRGDRYYPDYDRYGGPEGHHHHGHHHRGGGHRHHY